MIPFLVQFTPCGLAIQCALTINDYTTSKKYLFFGTIYSLWTCNWACIEARNIYNLLPVDLQLTVHWLHMTISNLNRVTSREMPTL